MIWVVRGYQRSLSGFMGRSCRYHPTCSAYAVTAIARFGALRGGLMALSRILRCHPFNPGGHDPVPQGLGDGEESATPHHLPGKTGTGQP